ncbi:fungal hydrophobin [Lentinus tigrinus ALCF2SS1-7]|uniref:Hydrophobin n=1 Tax=Lentinus tigrinus ALCF2SS1-6 TaxID=1328759 RepID=A0A5C2STG2_9APHY|nr:fungal hydrophobin [Lentinus tigrinus ALCF2SS1-6]RPD82869.1 fungal hydrophobin [Lentinus tigrinus ALCF2SS1-7]
MFARILTYFYFLLSLSLLAVAYPGGSPPPSKTTTVTVTAPASTVTSASQCSTGDLQCCKSVESASSLGGTLLLGLLGIVLSDLNVLLGLNCSPITVIGVGSGDACSANVVCCSNNNVGGLISIGCVPVLL